jgi:hypothetical protein
MQRARFWLLSCCGIVPGGIKLARNLPLELARNLPIKVMEKLFTSTLYKENDGRH